MLPRLMPSPRDAGNPAFVFLRSLIDTLEKRLAIRPVSRSAGPRVQAWVDERWTAFLKAHPGPWLLAENCQVHGLIPWLNAGTIFIRWRTQPPSKRFPVPPDPYTAKEPIDLGTFGHHSLSCRFYSIRPTLIAVDRQGKQVDWELFAWQRRRPESRPLCEAYRRAQLANIFAGTEFAVPKPGGTLGVPIRINSGGLR